MENKKNSGSIVLTVIGIATLLVALVGATFAYFSASATSPEQPVNTGKLNITTSLDDTKQKDIIPTTWDSQTIDNNKTNENIAKFTYHVNGANTTVRGAVYDIKLVGSLTTVSVTNGVTNQKGDSSQVKYKLINDSKNTVKAEGDFANIPSTAIITGQALTGSTNDTYTLYVYIEESNDNQDKLQGATVNATLDATAYTPKTAE